MSIDARPLPGLFEPSPPPSWVRRLLAAGDDGVRARHIGAALLLVVLAQQATFLMRAIPPAPTPMLFVAAVVIASWYGGVAAGVVASLCSTLALDYWFIPPVGSLQVSHPSQLLSVGVFMLVTVVISSTTEALRTARRRAEVRARELADVNQELEQQIEEVQTLSEDLQESNEYLAEARRRAERLATWASRLQEVTAELSAAASEREVAEVVLERGLVLLQARRAALLRLDGARLHVVSEVGDGAAGPRAILLDDHPTAAAAIRNGEPVWLAAGRRTGAADARADEAALLPRAASTGELVQDAPLAAALPLLHGGRAIGGLSLDFAPGARLDATDRAFAQLLADAAANAVHRARDFDAQQAGREAAEAVARAREEVLGIVAHDLRNPLNLISSATQLLFDQEVELAPERRARMYEVAMRAVRQMDRLIGDLLDTVRLQAGRLALDLEEVEVQALLAHAEELARHEAARRGIVLVVLPCEGPVRVRADSGRALQVLGNLLGNALKFTPAEGRVTLHAADEREVVRFAVSDTGPGIPEESRAQLFERFWQARRTDRRGAGLGLAISKGIVEAHGGRIWVESAPGAGSTFHFTLPAAAAPPS